MILAINDFERMKLIDGYIYLDKISESIILNRIIINDFRKFQAN